MASVSCILPHCVPKSGQSACDRTAFTLSCAQTLHRSRSRVQNQTAQSYLCRVTLDQTKCIIRPYKAFCASVCMCTVHDPSTGCLQVSSCNIFIVHGNTVKTPPLKGTILPGITRRSVITLLEDMGYNVIEEPVSITEAMQADEVFTTGTAVVVSSVGSITYQGTNCSWLFNMPSSRIVAVFGIVSPHTSKHKEGGGIPLTEQRRALSSQAGKRKIRCVCVL